MNKLKTAAQALLDAMLKDNVSPNKATRIAWFNLKSALAEPEPAPEPVAWKHDDTSYSFSDEFLEHMRKSPRFFSTTPQPAEWQELTPEQVFDAASNWDCGTRDENEEWHFSTPKDLQSFVEAISAAWKAKNFGGGE